MLRFGSWPLLGAFLVSASAPHLADSGLVPRERLAEIAEVRDVRMAPDGTIAGVVVNRSDRTIREVRLRVLYEFLWNDERSPGEESPGRLETETVPGPIPPGRSVAFAHEPARPLPDRSDGRFEPHVEIAEVLVVEEPAGAAIRPSP